MSIGFAIWNSTFTRHCSKNDHTTTYRPATAILPLFLQSMEPEVLNDNTYDRRKKIKFTNQREQKKSSYSPLRCNEVVREVGQDAIKCPMADAYLYGAVEITGEAPIAARICGSKDDG